MMMRSFKAWVALAALMVAATGVAAWACDKSKPCSGHKTAATTTANAENDGRSESTGSGSTPCAQAKSATTGTSPCGGGCKGCQHAKTTVTADAGSTPSAPCGAKSGTTVAHGATPCGKNCDEHCAKNCPNAAARIAAAAQSPSPAREKMNAVLASMPTIRYRVGEETTSCPKHAKALAGAGGTMSYVVGDHAYATEDEAAARLAELLEDEIKELVTMHYVVADESFECPMTARKVAAAKEAKVAYRVAGFDFAERDLADKTVELVKAAVSNVKMHYQVGDESFCCDRMAGVRAKETHKPIVYEVGGNSTPCAITAKRLMAEAKLRAIVEVAAEQVVSRG